MLTCCSRWIPDPTNVSDNWIVFVLSPKTLQPLCLSLQPMSPLISSGLSVRWRTDVHSCCGFFQLCRWKMWIAVWHRRSSPREPDIYTKSWVLLCADVLIYTTWTMELKIVCRLRDAGASTPDGCTVYIIKLHPCSLFPAVSLKISFQTPLCTWETSTSHCAGAVFDTSFHTNLYRNFFPLASLELRRKKKPNTKM